MRLLQRVLEYHNGNTLEMNNLCGYQLISFLMRRKHWVLDEPMLSIVFGITGNSSGFSLIFLHNFYFTKIFLLTTKLMKI